jgi:membrane-bound lytic murein transglycosylase MltF
VLEELPGEPLRAPHEGRSLLETVRERGRIRIGFVPGQRPYSHVNARGELVGFDVEMAHALALELGIAAELAPVPREQLADAIETDASTSSWPASATDARSGAPAPYLTRRRLVARPPRPSLER